MEDFHGCVTALRYTSGVAHRQKVKSFTIRIIEGDVGIHFTIQNLNTMRIVELSSWKDVLQVLQGRYPQTQCTSEPVDALQ